MGTLTMPHPYEDGMAEEWIGGLDQRWRDREALLLAMETEPDEVTPSTVR